MQLARPMMDVLDALAERVARFLDADEDACEAVNALFTNCIIQQPSFFQLPAALFERAGSASDASDSTRVRCCCCCCCCCRLCALIAAHATGRRVLGR